MLNQIGFKASIKTLNQTVYFSTIGNPKTKAQIGFDDWFQDFPHPGDFMGNLLTTAAAKSVPSFNNGFVSDPHIDQQVNALDAHPAADVASSGRRWTRTSTARQHAYVAPYGNEEDTAFYSTRMNVAQCSGYPRPGASRRLVAALSEVVVGWSNGRALRRPPDRPMHPLIDHIIARRGH